MANKPQLALNQRGPRGLGVWGDKKAFYGNDDSTPPSCEVEMITEAELYLLIWSLKHTDPDDGGPAGSMEKADCCLRKREK